jgi:AcrR family transcriptional regulator
MRFAAEITGTPRERLIASAVELVSERGFEEVSGADIAERAGVPASDLVDQFGGKDGAVAAGIDAAAERLLASVEACYRGEENWADGVRAGLAVTLHALAANPELVRAATVHLPGTGIDAVEHLQQIVDRFLRFLDAGRANSAHAHELPPETALMALGGAEAIVLDEIVTDRTEQLPDLLPEILFALLVPYLGPELAAENMREANEV